MRKWYHKGNERVRLEEGELIPDGFERGYGPRGTSWNKGLKASDDERVRKNAEKCHQTRKTNNNYHAWNKGLTKETDSRIKGLSGELNPMYGKHREAWNKGLTKETSESLRKMSNTKLGHAAWNKGLTKETDERMNKLSIIGRSRETKYKKVNTMHKNNSFKICDTKAEKEVYEKLLTHFSKGDIIPQYFDKERYPFKCDFYIKSADLFIEVNGNWTHGPHPFNKNNEEDIKTLNEWTEKSKTSKYYKNAVYVWTDLDVRKLNTAKENKLNFIAIYNNIVTNIQGGTLIK